MRKRLLGLSDWVWVLAGTLTLACHLILTIKGL